MSVKDLFQKSTQNENVLKGNTLSSLGNEIEDYKFVDEYKEDSQRFIPHIDFSKPENFVRFGSAKEYYKKAFERVYKFFPYDGSLSEHLEWENNSSVFEKYVYDNLYPKTTGYVTFAPNGYGTTSAVTNDITAPAVTEYILLKGGPHVDNIWLTSSYDTNNFYVDGTEGTTVEFWLKHDTYDPSDSPYQCVFDLWNGVFTSDNDYYAKLSIFVTGTLGATAGYFSVEANSYQNGGVEFGAGKSVTSLVSFDNKWHHYAITVKNEDVTTKTLLYFYKDGSLIETKNTREDGYTIFQPASIVNDTGSFTATIGALVATPVSPGDNAEAYRGHAKFSGSIDEFRFWRKARTDLEINKFYNRHIGGGTNDGSNLNLGAYYKFNEGIINSGTVDLRDAVVLDYSGRNSNGVFVGYQVGSRSTGSALVDSGMANHEFEDPIIYSVHPAVSSAQAAYEAIGEEYDATNSGYLYGSFPRWIQEEDEKNDSDVLKGLSQIVSNYFDNLHVQMECVPKLKVPTYESSSYRPYPFAKNLLQSKGLIVPEILTNVDVFEEFAESDATIQYSEKIDNIRNAIYQNIYNNLTYLYKTKGTAKSVRNLLHCIGIDEKLVRINQYADNAVYEMVPSYNIAPLKRKFVDFSKPANYGANVFQFVSGTDVNSNGNIAITNATNFGQKNFSLECEMLFGKKPDNDSEFYYDTPFLTSSLFGAISVTAGGTTELDYGAGYLTDLRVFAVRDSSNSKHARFAISSTYGRMATVYSPLYYDVYDDSKWNISFSLTSDVQTVEDVAIGSTSDYPCWHFMGVQTENGNVKNSFHISGANSVNTSRFFTGTSNKLVYIGANLTNATGTLIHASDVKVGSTKAYLYPISMNELTAHAIDCENYGVELPAHNANKYYKNAANVEIPAEELTILNWEFSEITGSSQYGQFVVNDFSSGSLAATSRYALATSLGAASIGGIVKYKHPGLGFGFVANDTGSITTEYVQNAHMLLPEVINSSDMVQVRNTSDDNIYTNNFRPTRTFMSIEKSMYQTISEEMLNLFATLQGYSNLVGEPVNRYRSEYKKMNLLRQLFFENVQNTPNLERFVDFYKWIDKSISDIIAQFLPASAIVNEDIRTVVESHILERSHFKHMYPLMADQTPTKIEGGTKSTNFYNWRKGFRPIGKKDADPQTSNCLYWTYKAERSQSPVANASNARNKYFGAITSSFNRLATTPYSLSVSLLEDSYNRVDSDNSFDFEVSIGNNILGFRTRCEDE